MKMEDLKEGKYFYVKDAEHVFCVIRIYENLRDVFMRAFYWNYNSYISSTNTVHFNEISDFLAKASYDWKSFPASKKPILLKCIFEE